MADTTYIPTQNDGMFGGGGLAAILIGSLLPRLTGAGYGAGMLGAEAMGGYGGGFGGTNQILQAMNQQQLASSTQGIATQISGATQILTQDILGSASTTQNSIANNTISNLQGQTALTKDIADTSLQNAIGHAGIVQAVGAANMDANAAINNVRNGISGDIRDALGVIDADLHGMMSTLGTAISSTRDDINRARFDNLDATHRAEIGAMRSAFDTQRAVYDTAGETQRTVLTDGDKTRELINRNQIMDLERQLSEARHDHRHSHTVDSITIANNNTAVSTSNAMQQQSQAQQQQAILLGLNALGAHVNGIQNTIVNMGNGNRTSAQGVQV
jgi:hypothetical protein